MEWIKVTERMPPLYETVLLTIRERWRLAEEWKYDVDVGYVNEHGTWGTYNDWDEGQILEITHWAPLPEPAGD